MHWPSVTWAMVVKRDTPETPSMHIAPSVNDRHATLDAMRGFAVLGILLTNIFIFALPYHALDLPEIWGEKTGANLVTWNIVIIFVDGVMRAILSVVFGASALIVMSRANRGDAGDALGVLDMFFRRLLCLIAFGLVHAYILLWPHDILFLYGLFGLFLFPFRALSARKMTIIAVMLLIASSWFGAQGASPIKDAVLDSIPAFENVEPSIIDSMPPLADMMPEFNTEEEPNANLDAGDTFAQAMSVIIEEIDEEIAIRQSGYLINLAATVGVSFDEQTAEVFRHHFLDIFPVMLLGMALFKSGFLTAEWPTRRYIQITMIGYTMGTIIGMATFLPISAPDWAHMTAIMLLEYGYELRRMSFAIGHMALLIVLLRKDWLTFLTRRLRDCGRLALTLYIGQTLLCLLLFYGVGIGLFGTMEHIDVLMIAIALIIAQLVIAGPVLRIIKSGPLEALLRALSGSAHIPASHRIPQKHTGP